MAELRSAMRSQSDKVGPRVILISSTETVSEKIFGLAPRPSDGIQRLWRQSQSNPQGREKFRPVWPAPRDSLGNCSRTIAGASGPSGSRCSVQHEGEWLCRVGIFLRSGWRGFTMPTQACRPMSIAPSRTTSEPILAWCFSKNMGRTKQKAHPLGGQKGFLCPSERRSRTWRPLTERTAFRLNAAAPGFSQNTMNSGRATCCPRWKSKFGIQPHSVTALTSIDS